MRFRICCVLFFALVGAGCVEDEPNTTRSTSEGEQPDVREDAGTSEDEDTSEMMDANVSPDVGEDEEVGESDVPDIEDVEDGGGVVLPDLPAVCGNGTLEEGEGCDDDNTITEACVYGETACTVCNAECEEVAGVATYCGDGEINGGEVCDDGNNITEACLYGEVSCTVCNAACEESAGEIASCGDGEINGDETCDDGNNVTEVCPYGETDCVVCNAGCEEVAGVATYCGDGEVNSNEACDDGNTSNEDSCTNACLRSVCGDGFVGPGESCDDGNLVDDDACTNDCAPANCGDGIPGPGEECDDENMSNTDACLNTCQQAECGDGFVQEGEEACDDAGDPNVMCPYGEESCTVCNDACEEVAGERVFCGDGEVNGAETCDDGNNTTEVCSYGDISCVVCNAECEEVAGEAAYCGDGEINGAEACDDGNKVTEVCAYGDTACVVCNAGCEEVAGEVAYCGDGDVNGAEACDDGNTVTEVCAYGDTDCVVCNAGCEEVPGEVAFCGDGEVNGDENCDDGNTDTETCPYGEPGCQVCGSGCVMEPGLGLEPGYQNTAWLGGEGFQSLSQSAIGPQGQVALAFTVLSAPSDLDPGEGVVEVSETGRGVTVLDRSGNYLWSAFFPGSNLNLQPEFDEEGDLFIAGRFDFGRVDLDPGEGVYEVQAGNGQFCRFLLRLDGDSGELVWSYELFETLEESLNNNALLLLVGGVGYLGAEQGHKVDLTTGLAMDGWDYAPEGDILLGDLTYANGKFFLFGRFTGTATLDPSSPESLRARSNAIFLARLDDESQVEWMYVVDTPGWDGGARLLPDGDGNLYWLTGLCQVLRPCLADEEVDLDPSDAESLAVAPSATLFKITQEGSLVWHRQVNRDSDFTNTRGLAIDFEGRPLVAGSFVGSIDFDPTEDEAIFEADGFSDVFVTRFDTNGDYLETLQMGGAGETRNEYEAVSSLQVDLDGNVYLTGGSGASGVDMDPTEGIDLHNSNDIDGFLWKWTLAP